MLQIQAKGRKNQVRFGGHQRLLPVCALPIVTALIRKSHGNCTEIPRQLHGTVGAGMVSSCPCLSGAASRRGDRTATQAPAFSNRLAVTRPQQKGVPYDTTARFPGSARRAHLLLMGRDILQATLLQCTSKKTTRTTNTDLAHRVRKETKHETCRLLGDRDRPCSYCRTPHYGARICRGKRPRANVHPGHAERAVSVRILRIFGTTHSRGNNADPTRWRPG